MNKHTDTWQPMEHGDEPISSSANNPSFYSVLERRYGRRQVLRGSIGAAVTSMFASVLLGSTSRLAMAQSASMLGFEPVPPGTLDEIVVPTGYSAQTLTPWGTPISGDMPAFSTASTGADQANQIGSHHDGIHFFPIDSAGMMPGEGSSEDGLLVMNHEYVEVRLMHASAAGQALGTNDLTFKAEGVRDADEVLKEINGHGVSVVRVARGADGAWAVVADEHNRRITGLTPMTLAGPVAGSDFVKTKFSPDGTMTRGTLNNCGNGVTPWNTYLTAEENWAGYFRNSDLTADAVPNLPREHARYGVSDETGRYAWELAEGGADEYVRYDASIKADDATGDYRNEPNTYGYIVEIDPFDPAATPVKHTALGRFGHESIAFAAPVAGRPIVAYSGDDARFEYIYKFVSAEAYDAATAGGHLLDDGTLFVAKFNEDGTGEWVALTHGENGLTEENGFTSQADVLVNTRSAADFIGATRMDRPEWVSVDPRNDMVYFTLTNNTARAEDAVDAANPRPNNEHGHIIRWREDGDDNAATTFAWDIFLFAGPEGASETLSGESLDESNIFTSPDGLGFDGDGRLWIQTDGGNVEIFGANQMLAADADTGEVRRFLTGPIAQEITGLTWTPDGRTMFINVQHPGESTSPEEFAMGMHDSHWPDGGTAAPRSSTVVITRDDGGVIGA